MKKIVYTVLKWTGITLLFLLAFGYLLLANRLVQQQERQVFCNKIDIEIADSALTRLVIPQDLHRFFNQQNIHLTGSKMFYLNTYGLEQLISKESGVKQCQVYNRINGVVTISLSQRVPLLRVEAPHAAYYIDDSGVLFPSVPNRTAYVPVVSGNIPLHNTEWMDKLYQLGSYIHSHRFWNAQVEQLHVHEPNNIELIQRAGTQTTVLMGDLSQFEYKLQKLYTFYRTVAATQGWDKYTSIDIRYGDQIVCRQKSIKP